MTDFGASEYLREELRPILQLSKSINIDDVCSYSSDHSPYTE